MGAEKELQFGWMTGWDKENCGKDNSWTSDIPAEAIAADIFPGFIADNIPDFHRGVGWYWNRFDLSSAPDAEQEYFLMLGYTEYLAEYWINGQYVGKFEGVRLNYEFEVGRFLREKDNLIAIRIVSPSPEGIDGFYCDRGSDPLNYDDNIVNRATGKDHAYGGIFYPVRLASRPRLRSGRIVVHPDYNTGAVKVTADLVNNTTADTETTILFTIISPSGQAVHTGISIENIPVGGCQTVLECIVENKKLWSVDEPNLYSVNLTLLSGQNSHTQKIDFGFRDFRVKDGYFCLNGKRMFLKSCNYGLTPQPNTYEPWNCKAIFKDIMYLKSLGYTMFRFLVANPYPEFIDMCNKAGALIYEEHAASWEMSDKNPNLEKQMEFHMQSVVRRDINHPSVVIFGLSNESKSPRVREYIKSALPMIRAEDMNKLLMLDSGRWDMDMSVGSVSNPGSMVWEHQWGGESPDGKVIPDSDIVFDGNGGSAPEMGDLHVYPQVPLKWSAVESVRNHGKVFKPCYVSEGGIGTFGNQIRLARLDEQWRGPARRERASQKYMFMRAHLLEQDFFRYKLDDVYPAPDDLSYQSCKANVYQRRLYNTMIRSNPRYAGFNPGLVDAAGVGVAPVDFSRECVRPFLADVQSESMAKLLWCVFINPTNVYAGQEFMVEAVLANEDVLYPGEYPVSARIVHPEYGCVWEHHTTLTIPEVPEGELGALAVPVFKEYLTLDVPEGEYQLTVWMDRGAIPAGGKQTFFITKPEETKNIAIQTIGLDEKTIQWLEDHGVRHDESAQKILVGNMSDEDAAWDALYAKVEAGAEVIFLKPETLLRNVDDPFNHSDYVPERLPFENKGYLTYAESWYYHPINVVRSTHFGKGLPKGVMDDCYWQMVTPQFLFHKQEIPDEIGVVTLAVPYFTSIDELIGYLVGVALGTYHYGKGKITLNCYKIIDTLGENPAADRLLMNMITRQS